MPPRINAGGAVLPPLQVRSGETLLYDVNTSQIAHGVPYAPFSMQNMLVNPSFEFWQRGNGPFIADGVYTADRWQISLGAGAAISVSPQIVQTKRSRTSLRLTYTHGGVNSYLRQRLVAADWLNAFLGQSVSLAGWLQAAAPVPGRLGRLRLSSDGSGVTSAFSPYIGSSLTYQRLVVDNFTIPLDATYLDVSLSCEGDLALDLDSWSLNWGALNQFYFMYSPSDELKKCQRYFEVHGASNNGWPRVSGYGGAGGEEITQPLTFTEMKGGTPSVTLNGAWALTNTAAVAVSGPDAAGYNLTISPTVAGIADAHTDSADDTITAEYNP